MLNIKQITAVSASLLLWSLLATAQEVADKQSAPQSRPTMRIRVSSGVLAGIIEHTALPAYPAQALQSGIRGDAIFKVLVDETGKVVRADIVEGDPVLIAASADALREFRFRPYALNGVPVQVESQMEFRFSTKGKGSKIKGKVEYVSDIPYRPEFRPGATAPNGILVLWPRKISGPEPHLPPELTGKSGSVYLGITIGVDG